MYSKQRGITLIGWLVLLIPIAILAFATIQTVPIWLNYKNVLHALSTAEKAHANDDTTTPQSIRNTLDKQLNLDAVKYPTSKEFAIRRDGKGWIVQAAYQDSAHMFGPVWLLLKFDNSVEIR